MSELDLPNKFLRALYKFTDDNDLEVDSEKLWKFANTLTIIADRKKFSKIYNSRQKDLK